MTKLISDMYTKHVTAVFCHCAVLYLVAQNLTS